MDRVECILHKQNTPTKQKPRNPQVPLPLTHSPRGRPGSSSILFSFQLCVDGAGGLAPPCLASFPQCRVHEGSPVLRSPALSVQRAHCTRAAVCLSVTLPAARASMRTDVMTILEYTSFDLIEIQQSTEIVSSQLSQFLQVQLPLPSPPCSHPAHQAGAMSSTQETPSYPLVDPPPLGLFHPGELLPSLGPGQRDQCVYSSER